MSARIVSKQMNYFLSSYTKAINKQQSAHGSLFEKNFRRILINDENYLRNLVVYIHFNPVKHDITDNPSNWIYSSYNLITSGKSSKLQKKNLLDWFGGKENYLSSQPRNKDLEKISDYLLE
jgi:putative transposase